MFKGVSVHHGHVFAVNVIVGVLSICLALIVVAFDTLSVNASGDSVVPFSGTVMDESGEPVTNSSLQMIFRLYDSGTNGQCVWSNSSSTCGSAMARTVYLTNGVFSETLGDTARGYASMDEIALTTPEAYIGLVIEGQIARIGVNGDIFVSLPEAPIEEEEPIVEEPEIPEPIIDEPVVEDGEVLPPPVVVPPTDSATPGSGSETGGTTNSGGGASTVLTVSTKLEAGGKELRGGASYQVLPGMPIDLVVTLSTSAKEVRVTQGGVEVPLRKESDRVYRARLGATSSTVVATATSTSGAQVDATVQLEQLTVGSVREVVDAEARPSIGATATLYAGNLPWIATYGQTNPIIVGESGAVGWLVENGAYRVEVAKEGFLKESQTILVTDAVIAPSIILNQDPAFLVESENGQATEEGMSDSVTTASEAVAFVRESIDAFRATKEAQIVSDVAVPVAVASAVGGTTSLATSFNILPYLQYLFTSPILYIARRRRRPFGRVYNGYTKVPIALATIQLLRDGKIVKTTVTDEEGRFFLRAEPGEYLLQVKKPTFIFPSSFVQSTTDGDFLDIYRGGTLRVTEDNVFISPNIPIDHIEAQGSAPSHSHRLTRALRVAQRIVAVLGVVLALFALVVNQNLGSLAVFLLQFIVLVVTLILARPKRLKGWATVLDGTTRTPIANAVIRLFEPTYNKLLETTVTDRFGRYAFVVGPNTYYLTASVPGYTETVVKPIDRSAMRRVDTLAVDVLMQRPSAT